MRHLVTRSLQVSLALGVAPLVLVAAAQASGKPTSQAPAKESMQAGTPLASYTSQRIAVMPVQAFRADTSSPVKVPDLTALRKEIDDSIGTAIAERGVGKKWAYAADLARMAKRNAGYVSDPYTLGVGSLRTRPLKPEEQVQRMLIDNMRSLIAIGDARLALVPVELAVSKRGPEVRALLRLVMLDGRVGQVVWYTDLGVEVGSAFGSAEIGVLAQRVADLVSAR